MNPHTLDTTTGTAQPLWCSAEDLSALIFHPEMQQTVRETVRRRSQWLNLLSDTSKLRLAEAARELYSATLQGFYDWVAKLDNFDSIMTGIGIRASRSSILVQIEDLQRRRRQNTITAIQSTLGTQASEHFCEPPGLGAGELYTLLEVYKGGVARQLIEYIEQLGDRRQLILRNLRSRMASYCTNRLTKMIERYMKAVTRRPGRRREELLFRIAYAEPRVGVELNRAFKPRIRLFRPRSHRPAPIGGPPRWSMGVEAWMMHPELGAPPTIELRINGARIPLADSATLFKTLGDLVPHFMPRSRCKVAFASLAGGFLQRACPGKRSRSLYRHSNRLLRSLAEQWLAKVDFAETVEALLVDGPKSMLYLESAAERVRHVRKALRRQYRDAMFQVVAQQMAHSASDIFELQLISVQLSGGYDDFTGTLLDKLRATMQGRTCVQDIGGELCEMLSCPFSPEHNEQFQPFQVDHTGVPPLIKRHLSGWRTPVYEAPLSFDRSIQRLLQPIDEVPEERTSAVYSITHL
jgi:hypothetical protein